MKKASKKEVVFNYLRENPSAKNNEVAKACGVHPTYASFVRRNAGVKTPKATPSVEFDKAAKVSKVDSLKAYNTDLLNRINELINQNLSLKDDIVRLCGVIEYLEQKIEHATSI